MTVHYMLTGFEKMAGHEELKRLGINLIESLLNYYLELPELPEPQDYL